MSLSGWRRPTSTGGVGSRANFAGAAGPHPASGEGKLVLTTGPWSQTTATGIPEGFHSGLPWKGCRERRGSEGPHAARCFTPAFHLRNSGIVSPRTRSPYSSRDLLTFI